MAHSIRDAVATDAEVGCVVLRRSIVELCAADHNNDATFLGNWLSNKTPAVFRSWIVQPGNSVLVAVEQECIIAVGSVTDAGNITLNYVSPDVRFRGVSKAMLFALEARAIDRGSRVATLNSTETAHRFYLANGYVDVGPRNGGNAGTLMRKVLNAADA